MTTGVTVVVPVHNRWDLVETCLSSVPAGAEIVVVDDASTDGTADMVQERFPDVRLLRNEINRGFGATVNRGLQAASGEVMVVLNSDARFLGDALDRLAAAFADPGVGIAGGRLVFADGSHQTSAASFPTVANLVTGSFALTEIYSRVRPGRKFRWELGLSRRDHAESRDVDWVMGACLAISRACFEATGGFDESYRMYFEECDLCWRAHRAGFRVRYVADAKVVHLGGASGGGDPGRQALMILDGEARFMERAYGSRTLRRWRAARLASSAFKTLAFGAVSPFDSRMRDRRRWHAGAVRHLWEGGRSQR